MTLLKTGACFTAELAANCPTIKACIDGSETKVTAGTNTTVTGTGTTTSPYVVSSTATAASTPFATPAETIAGTSATLAVNPAGLAAAIPQPVINAGSVAGVGVSFAPAGTYTSSGVAQTLTGATTTLTNTTNRPQLVNFTLTSEAIWYAPFAGALIVIYELIIDGVPVLFNGLSRIPPYMHNEVDNRHMTGVISHVLPANTSATFALKETMRESDGFTVVVPANTLLSYGGFVTYVQHSV